jgi:hypothetical protein
MLGQIQRRSSAPTRTCSQERSINKGIFEDRSIDHLAVTGGRILECFNLGISGPTNQMVRLQLSLNFNTVPRIEAACLPVEGSRDLDNAAWSICMWLGAVPENHRIPYEGPHNICALQQDTIDSPAPAVDAHGKQT